MIYTLYRPQTFSQVLGQGDLIDILKAQAKTGDFHHAYLFYGDSGTGKTSTARILAMALNCQAMDGIGEPCLKCQSCQAIAKGNSWDVIEFDSSSIRIEEAKEIKARAYLAPFGNKKVYIFDECQLLTEAVFNSLLKLLEEPPPHLTIILTTTAIPTQGNPMKSSHKIPLTVLSRCQLYSFSKLTASDIKGKLKRIAQDLGLEVEENALNFIAETSCGNMRCAENLLEQCFNSGKYLKGKGEVK